MDLSNLHPAEGSKHSDNFRRGRGHASGNGKTAGKGHKGSESSFRRTETWFRGRSDAVIQTSPEERLQTS